MSYLSSNSAVQAVQLAVQTLVLKKADNQIVSTSANTATIDVGQTISEVRCASFIDDSAGTGAPVVASNRTVSGSSVTLNLGAALATADAIVISYVVEE